MKFDGGYDEAYMALLNKGLMSVGEDGLFEVSGVDVGTIIQLKKVFQSCQGVCSECWRSI